MGIALGLGGISRRRWRHPIEHLDLPENHRSCLSGAAGRSTGQTRQVDWVDAGRRRRGVRHRIVSRCAPGDQDMGRSNRGNLQHRVADTLARLGVWTGEGSVLTPAARRDRAPLRSDLPTAEMRRKPGTDIGAGDTDRDNSDLCFKWDIILNGPGDLRRFAEEMAALRAPIPHAGVRRHRQSEEPGCRSSLLCCYEVGPLRVSHGLSRWNSRTCSALRRKIAADAKVTSRLAGRSIPRQVEAERQIPGKAQPGWVSRFVNVRSAVCELKVGYRVVLPYSATVLVEDDDDRIRFLSGRHLRTGREKFNN